MEPLPANRRRWIAVSLRTLFAIVTLAAIPLGWLASEVRVVHKRHEAKLFLREKGAILGKGRLPLFVLSCKNSHSWPQGSQPIPWLRNVLFGDDQFDWIWLPSQDEELRCAASVLEEASVHAIQ
jgi:hypothetical protein